MAVIAFSKKTERDIDHLRAAWGDFAHDLRTPWTYVPGLIAAMIAAAMMMLPWLTVNGE